MIVYDTTHPSSEIVCTSLAKGLVAPIVRAPWPRPLETPAAFYGRDRGCIVIPRQCEANGDPWFMIDNGYMTPRGGSANPNPDGEFKGYYKISRNGYQCDGHGEPDYHRLKQILELTRTKIARKWRKPTPTGHILICPPIVEYERIHWHSHSHFIRFCKQEIQKVTNRPSRIRYKPGDKRDKSKRKLGDDLTNCYAVITHDSNIIVDAYIRGIPCFVTGKSPAQVHGNVDIQNIKNPNLDFDREHFLAILANNQWTLKEIRAGMANETLERERIGP